MGSNSGGDSETGTVLLRPVFDGGGRVRGWTLPLYGGYLDRKRRTEVARRRDIFVR